MKFLLVMFGWLAVITSLLIILVPYILRKSDLISGWTLFQVSCANYLGWASIQSGNAYTHLYITPMPEDYLKFVLGGVVFYIVAILTYYFFPWPRRLADRMFRKSGPRTPSVLMALLPVCLALTMGYLFVPQIQFLGQWLVMLGRGTGMIGVAFCLVIWSQRPFNVTFGVAFGVILVFALVAAAADFGRRDLIAVIMTVPICWYWLRARSYNPARTLMVCGVFATIGALVITGITIGRGARANPDHNILEAAWDKLSAIPDALSGSRSSGGILGSDAVEASLAAIRLYDSLQKPQPFHALKYVLIHPIPRAWWPDKPVGLGLTLPWDTGFNRAHGSTANIGPGVVGHGYHEGGLLFVAFYAFLFASVIRWFDTLLARDPTNPYLLAGFSACSGQLVALVRGDIGLFMAIMIGAWFAAMLMNYLGRIFFWTDRLPTPEEAAQAAMVQPDYNWAEPAPAQFEAWRI